MFTSVVVLNKFLNIRHACNLSLVPILHAATQICFVYVYFGVQFVHTNHAFKCFKIVL
jgi:hypothetical protein